MADPDGFYPLEVRFVPGGGFNKRGSLVELKEGEERSEDTPEYEICNFVSLTVRCVSLRYMLNVARDNTNFNFDGPEATPKPEYVDRVDENLAGLGEIQPSLYGAHSLSILGTDQRHHTVEVSIRRTEENRYYLLPFRQSYELDDATQEHFALQVDLSLDAFDRIKNLMEGQPNCEVEIRVQLDGLPGFYTTWSPSVSDGRTLKFLDRKDDVTNAKELPEYFRDAFGPGTGSLNVYVTHDAVQRQAESDEADADDTWPGSDDVTPATSVAIPRKQRNHLFTPARQYSFLAGFVIATLIAYLVSLFR